jgi:hypothetical protein
MGNKFVFIVVFMLIYIGVAFVSFEILNLNIITGHIIIGLLYGLILYFLNKKR